MYNTLGTISIRVANFKKQSLRIQEKTRNFWQDFSSILRWLRWSRTYIRLEGPEIQQYARHWFIFLCVLLWEYRFYFVFFYKNIDFISDGVKHISGSQEQKFIWSLNHRIKFNCCQLFKKKKQKIDWQEISGKLKEVINKRVNYGNFEGARTWFL